MDYIYVNDQLQPADTLVAGARNRGLRYGDGLFETILVRNGKIIFESLHYDRLFHGLAVLQFQLPAGFTREWLTASILGLCNKNNVSTAARVRLNVFRGNGNLFEADTTTPTVVIEADPLSPDYLQLNARGWTVGIYTEAHKPCDLLANLKSNNYLPYVMAARYARDNGFHDCLLQNAHGRICDSTIANLFWVKDQHLFTPPLTEGCVAGVMRRFLVQQLQASNYPFTEQPATAEVLLQADELFLTNSLFGIRWVGTMKTAVYGNSTSTALHRLFVNQLT
jgi:branched-chain amino acid aminotransferase